MLGWKIGTLNFSYSMRLEGNRGLCVCVAGLELRVAKPPERARALGFDDGRCTRRRAKKEETPDESARTRSPACLG